MKTDEKIETILRQVWVDGWDRGKRQAKTPYDYLLGDEAFLKGKWLEIMELLDKKYGKDLI